MNNDSLLNYLNEHPEDKIVIYGAGNNGRRCLNYIGKADYFVDKRANEICYVEGIKCIEPNDVYSIDGNKIILLSMADISARRYVKNYYKNLKDATIFEFVRTLDDTKYAYNNVESRPLKINIVYPEDGWIFGKFAKRLEEYLSKMGQICTLSTEEDPKAEINHYVGYVCFSEIYAGTNTKRTTMITHVDSAYKRDLIKMQIENGAIGICMSKDTLDKLKCWGIAPEKICYINPAHDGDIKPRKIIIGITNRCYNNRDCRKRDDLIIQVMKQVDRECFKVVIMGEGWDLIVDELRNIGTEVDYYSGFDRDIYMNLMPSFDYWLYYGFDEGAMGFLDALAAGVKTIVTPQGYHLDVNPGPTYTCNTIDDFVNVFNKISGEKKIISQAVKEWTWERFTQKHLELWRYMTGTITMKELHMNQNEYLDGVFSLLLSDNSIC